MTLRIPQSDVDNLQRLELRIRHEFTGRIHNFHIEQRYDGLALQGQSSSYHRKQEVQQAVMRATKIPIRANNIVVS